jgi:uncharacterized protein (TIGR03083 family)
MTRSHDDALRWVRQGTTLFRKAAAGITDDELRAPSGLPGWTKGNLIAHVAANAVALRNLATWASTGVETPMYASAEERSAGIARGATLSAVEAAKMFDTSAQELTYAMDMLTPEQWTAEVRTVQGRTLPATELPWLRSREVMVHAVDLGRGIEFDAAEDDFLQALCDDVVVWRNGREGPAVELHATDTRARWQLHAHGVSSAGRVYVAVVGPVAEVAAYLTGRPHRLRTADGAEAPSLPPWL